MACSKGRNMCCLAIALLCTGIALGQALPTAAIRAQATAEQPTVARLSALTLAEQKAELGPPVEETPADPGLRQGGDTCATAVVIGSLPYTDSGTTAGYVNDYDSGVMAGCPYSGSTAPDVVYAYTPAANIYVDISLCTSLYDTKLYIFEGACPGPIVACNDDACGSDGYKSQLLGVGLTGGTTYYIVVDGYSSSSGSYTLQVAEGEPPPDCPTGSLFSQPVELVDWTGANSDEAGGYVCYESFSGLGASPICDLHWWGINAFFTGSSWVQCTKPNERFEITFYADAGGNPGAVMCGPYIVTPLKENTGETFGDYPLYYYSVPNLLPCCALDSGWIAIKGLNDGQNCWFLWAAARTGNGAALQYDIATGTFAVTDYDMSICLTGEYVPTFGACCDLRNGTCVDNVEMINCMGPYKRFVQDTLCVDLQPPCAAAVGACCYANGACQVVTYQECMTQLGDLNCDGTVDFADVDPFVLAIWGEAAYYAAYPDCVRSNADINGDGVIDFQDIDGFILLLVNGTIDRFWLGPNTTCDDCPCIVVCPEGAGQEQEPCGQSTNGGCNSTPPVFEPMPCGKVICGTAWFDGSTRDTDWFELVVTGETEITFTVEADFDVLFGMIEQVIPGVPGCDNITGYVNPYVLAGPCDKQATVACVPPGTYYLFVAPQFTTPVTCPGNYVASVSCEPCVLPRGACCFGDGACTPNLLESECQAAGGVWQGEGIGCDPNPCIGACCFEDGSCQPDLGAATCAAAGGAWQGGLTSCDPNPCPQPQPGDNCSLPLVVNIPADLPYTDAGQTTCGRRNNYADTCLDSYDGGEDIIYQLVVTAPTDVEITMNPLGTTWTGIALDEVCPLGPGTADCIAKSTSSSGTFIHNLGCRHLEPGVYTVMVDTWPAPDCIPAFDLTITTCIPPVGRCCYGDPVQCADVTEAECTTVYGGSWTAGLNCTANPCPEPFAETCETAKVIAAVPYATSFDNDLATADGPPGSCNSSTALVMQNDAWFKYTPTVDCFMTMFADMPTYDGITVIYTGPDCANLTEIACLDDPEPHNWTFAATAGTTYWFQIGDWGTGEGGGLTPFTLDCSAGEGACCFPSGACQIQTAADCATAGGVYQGDGTVCDPNPCPQPVPGDDCGLPIQVVLDAASLPYVDTNYTCGRGNDYNNTCLGSYDGGEDIMYELVVNEPLYVVVTLNPKGTTWTGFAIDELCPLGPGTTDCIAKSTNSGSTPHSIPCTYLATGVYYLMVDTYPAPDCIPEFDLTIDACPLGACCDANLTCVSTTYKIECDAIGGTWYIGETCPEFGCPDPTIGNNCENPWVVNLPGDLPFLLANTTCGRGNDYSDTCMGSYDGAEDMMFMLVVSEQVCLNITLQSNSIWGGMAVDGVCPLDPGTNDCIAKAATSANPDLITGLTLAPGVYYLMVDDYPSPNCIDFTLSMVQCP